MLDFLFKKDKPIIRSPTPPYSYIDFDEYEKAINTARRLQALGNTVSVARSVTNEKPCIQIIGERKGI